LKAAVLSFGSTQASLGHAQCFFVVCAAATTLLCGSGALNALVKLLYARHGRSFLTAVVPRIDAESAKLGLKARLTAAPGPSSER
jgi:hypothetical protein